ncbi:MAG: hypothetical protein JNL66_06125 [Alphaproteobacteria bacterium]|nr:hypothetical protein [Alphaproteobacteria bacterium]
MPIIAWCAALAAALLLAACTDRVTPPVVPVEAAVVQLPAGGRIPGRWLVTIDAAALDATLQANSALMLHGNYPIAGSGPFREAAKAMVAAVVETVEPAAAPSAAGARDALQEAGVGRITIRVDRFAPMLQVQTRQVSRLSAEQTAIVVAPLTVTLSVQAPDGRTFRTVITATRTERGPTDFTGSADRQVAAATANATRLAIEAIGQRLAAAPWLQAPPPAQAPAAAPRWL